MACRASDRAPPGVSTLTCWPLRSLHDALFVVVPSSKSGRGKPYMATKGTPALATCVIVSGVDDNDASRSPATTARDAAVPLSNFLSSTFAPYFLKKPWSWATKVMIPPKIGGTPGGDSTILGAS